MADLTRVPTGEGVLWLASVRDAFSDRVVGWKTAARAYTDLVLTALEYALVPRRPCRSAHPSQRQGMSIHRDPAHQNLADAGIAPSTGSTGDSYDNALAENLWSTLKTELIYWPGTAFATRTRAEVSTITEFPN